MRKLFRTVLFLLYLVLSVTLQAQVFQNIPLLTVTGEAAVKVLPDMAVLTLDIEKPVSNVGNNLSSAAFLFSDADIQVKLSASEDVEIRENAPIVRFRDGSQYFVKEYIITVKNMSRLQDLVIDLYRRNVTTITGISYRYSAMETLYAQARRQAVVNARGRAQIYSDAAGQDIGKAFQIKELVMETKNSFERLPMIQISDMLGEKYVLNPGYITVYCKTEVSYDLVK
ncbi:MAG: SIMPL domain-containing protein [Bacteroidetes bacterium]|nr:SIMPL domain-containing protein [Bacteroidota bacterium]